jgi:predicted nucleotidyltransferase component of viral defense system
MSLFDRLVDEALRGQGVLAPLRVVVEKELLHHDILREMSEAGLLSQLTFIGGTCLRACYGSNRLSEDLDFTGGADFSRDQLAGLRAVLIERMQDKYGLKVEVAEPRRDTGDVDTWKLKVVTRPSQRDLPPQRIHIDICAIPSHDRRPRMLRNHYGVDMGTAGLIVQAQSREEILADKLVAFVLRNRIKHRDLWDIAWLKQQGVVLPLALLPLKLADHRRGRDEFLLVLDERSRSLRSQPGLHDEFRQEMRRFLPAALAATTVEQGEFWAYITGLVEDESRRASEWLTGRGTDSPFSM